MRPPASVSTQRTRRCSRCVGTASTLVARVSALGEDAVELAAGLGQELGCSLALVLRAGVRHLPCRDADLHGEVHQLADVVGDAFARLLPRLAEALAVLFEVRASRVGQLVDGAALAGLAADQSLVGEQLEGGVDGARARAPRALAPLLELLHHLVAVARLLAEQEQDGGADVAAAHPSPAPEAELAGAVQRLREEVPGRPEAGTGTGAGAPHVDAISFVHDR